MSPEETLGWRHPGPLQLPSLAKGQKGRKSFSDLELGSVCYQGDVWFLGLPINWQVTHEKTNSAIKINCAMLFRHSASEA